MIRIGDIATGIGSAGRGVGIARTNCCVISLVFTNCSIAELEVLNAK